jgi:hypothetical protein
MAGDYVTLRALPSTAAKEQAQGSHFPVGLFATLRPKEALRAAEEHAVADQDPSAEFDRRLHRTCLSSDDPGAFLCLRCRCSHAALEWLKHLFNQWQQWCKDRGDPLEPLMIAACLLNDDGRLERFSREGPAERVETPADANSSSARDVVTYESFLMDVVRSFDPNQGAGLNRWTQLRAISNECLKIYFRTVGVVLKSDWTLLAHNAGPRNMAEAWRFHGQLGLATEHVVELLAAYQKVYTSSSEKRERGWHPSPLFFQAVAPNQPAYVTERQLEAMGQAFRDRLTTPWSRQSVRWSFDDPQDAPASPRSEVAEELEGGGSWDALVEEGDEDVDKLLMIDAALRRAIQDYLPQVLGHVETMAEQLRCLWLGVADSMDNRAIASRCACSVGSVSKKATGALNRVHLPAIARRALKDIKQQGYVPEVGRDLNATEKAVEALAKRLVARPSAPGGSAGERRRSVLGEWLHHHLSRP